jgi:thiaminase/transcriptional activator TenA
MTLALKQTASTDPLWLEGGFCDTAWANAASIREATHRLPLLSALSDGTLSPDVFSHYIVQDALYLKEYARCLAYVAAKAPVADEMMRFLKSAQTAIEVEQALHAGLLSELGVTAEDLATAKPSPAGLAYTSFILATCQTGSYGVALAAILPCFWIYWDVGESIKQKPATPGNRYQRWIDTYGDPEFAKGAQAVIAITNAAADRASPAERDLMLSVFQRASQYEWMFWQSAWELETWPV